MKTGNFDALLAGIREETPSAAALDQSAARVRERLFNSGAAGGGSGPDRLRGCADFQALIPAYINRTLTPAKAMLLTDHTHQCVACRQALEAQRSGKVAMLRRPQTVSTRVSPVTRWAVAAMVALGVGAGAWMTARSMMTPPGARATVQTVNGILYRVSNASSTPVFSGRELGEREIARTSKGSTALLRLADGSTVEMNERSELRISRDARGATVQLARGNIIVHAAKQRNGALYVKTADCEVMVKGTIFAVTSGTKGSRVSVVEGSVKVDQGSRSRMLKPGDQATTSDSVGAVPVQDEVAWSRDATQYLAVLGELSGLQKQIEQMPGPGVRTSSKLLEYVPANTAVYAAIPNIGATLGQAVQLFNDRMEASPVLKQWWEETGHARNGPDLQNLVQKLRAMSDYLGDEVVLAVASDGNGRGPGSPILLAEAARPGLREFLQNEMVAMNAKAGKNALELVENPAALRLGSNESPSAKVYLANGIVALTPQPELLINLAARMQNPSSVAGFSDSDFHQRIQQAYAAGASWLFCADLDAMRRQGSRFRGRGMQGPRDTSGFGGIRYLVLERKDVNGQTRNQATLAFNGNRRGLASWLAPPGPMSTLDFISPEASLAASFVIQNPGALLEQFIADAEASHPEFQQKLNEFQAGSGVNVVNDIAKALGGELTFAIDGPVLPTPSWKLAVEVYSPDNLKWAFDKLVNGFNQQPNAPFQLQLTHSTEGGLTFYTLKPVGGTGVASMAEIDYVFVDSYLLAAANRGLLTSAIQNRGTGYTLPRSEKFRNQLPKDANSNFSAIVYHNVGGVVAPLADGLKAMNSVSPEQKQAIEALQANSAPGLIYAYGEPGRITISANGSLFGFSLDTLAVPKVLENMMRHKP